MLVFLDVDGTSMEAEGDFPRPFLLEFCQGVTDRGGTIVLWTAGPRTYAELKYHRMPESVQSLISAIHSKGEPALRDYLRTDTQRRFFVDDMEELVQAQKKAGYGGVVVSRYVGAEDDRCLLAALEEFARFMGSPATIEARCD